MQALQALGMVAGYIAMLAGVTIGLRFASHYATERGIPRGDSRRAVLLFGGFLLWPAITAYVLARLLVRRARLGRWA